MELFKLFGTILVDNDKANKSIHQTESLASKASAKIGSAVKTIGKIGIAGATAFASGIAVLTKKAVENYSEYEQLVGGVETLFKKSGNTVLNYANNAYKTAGMSANQYMETVTSFSASLLSALDGDTAKSAKVANMAITDMSDNANKMGTSMEMIQNAYQGFAKQNYTMLDNLKLGYGGTKTEMERLLADAEKLSGTKYDISNLNDVFEAIHVVQTKLGITGTTAKEASTTIQGSITAMKASWENLMTGMADPKQDIGLLIGNMIDSVVIVINNLVPRIMGTIPRVVQGVGKLVQTVGKYLPSMIQGLLPVAIQGATVLVNGLFGAVELLLSNLEGIRNKAIGIMDAIGTTLRDNIPTVASKSLDMIEGFVDKIAENLPYIISAGMDLLHNLVQGIMNALPMLIERVPTIVSKIANLINDNMPLILAKGVDIIVTLIKGLISAIPTLIANIPKIIQAILDVWTAFNWLKLGENVITGIKNGLTNMKKSIVETAKNIFNSVKASITSPISSAKNAVSSAFNAIKSTFSNVGNSVLSIAKNTFNNVKNAILHPIETAKKLIKGIVDSIKGFFNFSIKFPHIPLPHFSIKPSGWDVGDLLKGKIPSLGIDWYAKAMDNGMILDKPTIFGAANGKLLGAGEAGSETVVGTQSLMNMIHEASSQNDERLLNVLLEIKQYLADEDRWYRIFLRALKDGSFSIILDGREVGRIVRKYA